MSNQTLMQHLSDLQQCLKRFSLLAESKHENQLAQLEKLKENFQRSYISKINYLSIVNQKRNEDRKCKTIVFDNDISNIYSYSVITQIKEILRAFKNDPYSMRIIIKDVILNWKRQDQVELAECLVS